MLFHGFGSLRRMQGILSWIQFVGRETMKCERSVKMRHLPSGLLSVAGQKRKVLLPCNKKVGRAPEIALNVLNLLFFIAVERASRRARPVRSKPRPEEWLSSPDREHQDLSMCIEKPARARYFRPRACQICNFITCARKFMPASPPCPN